ncbi:hypothetical protein IMZ48_25295 [Candidatus Bathyarchaeota archaeon]|nr:hypothetical protein [Candidatus Bathyarchaeota archaeon]
MWFELFSFGRFVDGIGGGNDLALDVLGMEFWVGPGSAAYWLSGWELGRADATGVRHASGTARTGKGKAETKGDLPGSTLTALT